MMHQAPCVFGPRGRPCSTFCEANARDHAAAKQGDRKPRDPCRMCVRPLKDAASSFCSTLCRVTYDYLREQAEREALYQRVDAR